MKERKKSKKQKYVYWNGSFRWVPVVSWAYCSSYTVRTHNQIPMMVNNRIINILRILWIWMFICERIEKSVLTKSEKKWENSNTQNLCMTKKKRNGYHKRLISRSLYSFIKTEVFFNNNNKKKASFSAYDMNLKHLWIDARVNYNENKQTKRMTNIMLYKKKQKNNVLCMDRKDKNTTKAFQIEMNVQIRLFIFFLFLLLRFFFLLSFRIQAIHDRLLLPSPRNFSVFFFYFTFCFFLLISHWATLFCSHSWASICKRFLTKVVNVLVSVNTKKWKRKSIQVIFFFLFCFFAVICLSELRKKKYKNTKNTFCRQLNWL